MVHTQQVDLEGSFSQGNSARRPDTSSSSTHKYSDAELRSEIEEQGAGGVVPIWADLDNESAHAIEERHHKQRDTRVEWPSMAFLVPSARGESGNDVAGNDAVILKPRASLDDNTILPELRTSEPGRSKEVTFDAEDVVAAARAALHSPHRSTAAVTASIEVTKKQQQQQQQQHSFLGAWEMPKDFPGAQFLHTMDEVLNLYVGRDLGKLKEKSAHPHPTKCSVRPVVHMYMGRDIEIADEDLLTAKDPLYSTDEIVNFYMGRDGMDL
jgi:hypothetical protein